MSLSRAIQNHWRKSKVTYNDLILEDANSLKINYPELFDQLEHKCILVTGATGLIGKTLVTIILNNTKTAKVAALARNKEKAELFFSGNPHKDRLSFIISDITQPFSSPVPVDYIIHAASETSSKAFITTPVNVISTTFKGTQNLLEFANANKVESFVYLSTMEIYGAPKTDEKINESHGTNLISTEVRTCYPESKRLCETLCAAYASEYGVPAKILRLTQTFGPGVAYNDGRVFAEFARCAIEGKNIVLHTKGETKRNYLYTADAVSAILTVLLKGENGEAYNAANESTYCSIYEMAKLVAEQIANNKIKVIIEESDISKFGYAPPLKMNLDTAKLKKLGWNPTHSLKEMFEKTIHSMAG